MVKRSWWERVQGSIQRHERPPKRYRDERGRFMPRAEFERRERLRTGVVKREPTERVPHIPTVAEQAGLEEAIDVARVWGIHPDEWAEELAEDFDYETHALYDSYFYPAAGAGAW